MNILVIKQTSLGDVLHSTGIVRSIKQAHPEAKIVLLTATSSMPIYRYNPWVDEIIEFDRYAIKYQWKSKPLWCLRHIRDTIKKVRRYEYAVAFDLQGLFKSVVFLYAARAPRKFIKGRWPKLQCFHNRQLHAIKEMQCVVQMAGIVVNDNSMEMHGSEQDNQQAQNYIKQLNKDALPVVIISAFTRAEKKDWPLDCFMHLTAQLSKKYLCILTGAPERAGEIGQALVRHNLEKAPNIANAAGAFSLLTFCEVVGLADVVVSADSFAVHLAGAKKTPVVALFGPTDETKVGPLGEHDIVVRAQGNEEIQKQVKQITVHQVEHAVDNILTLTR